MAVVEAQKAMLILMILYGCAVVFGFLASIPMIMHVYPQSECLLFSYPEPGDKLSYGSYATCNIVAYVFLFVIFGDIYLFVRCLFDRRRRHGHAKAGKFEDQRVPMSILIFHLVVTLLALLLTLLTTTGYIMACENLQGQVSGNIANKLNANPYETRGEEILTRYEDDYKFHRYTNRYGNAFGSEFYTIRITCRSILTDPEIHQKLHDTHTERHSRYYGYWYGLDTFAYDSQYEATKTNALIEASMGGSWLCFGCLLAGAILMIIQRFVLQKEENLAERMSVHSTMMGVGANSTLGRDGTMSGRNGSVMSGSVRGSNFQRGGSLRGSDRSIKSHRRDFDDMALSMHHMGGSQHLLAGGVGGAAPRTQPGGYGRKDIDDMVRKTATPMARRSTISGGRSTISGAGTNNFFKRSNTLQLEAEQPHGIMILNGDGLLNQNNKVLNQHIAANSNPSVPLHGQYPSHYSSRETGYNSGTEYNTQLNSGGYPRGYLNPDSTILHQREEVETEIF